MYVTVQIPVLDVRSLMSEETCRDPQPYWPVPVRRYSRGSRVHHRSNFVRRVGPVRPRLKGGVAPWLSESSYVDLRGLLRLGAPERLEYWQGATRPVYRNFYTDGVIGRLEVCFLFRDWRFQGSTGTDALMRRYALSAPTWLRGRPDDAVPLVDFGSVFAEHLLAATTLGRPREAPEYWDPDGWWVSSAAPALIMEKPGGGRRRDDEDEEDDEEDRDDGAVLSQEWENHGGTRVADWLVDQRGADDETMRRLRVHVSRLHATFSAVETVLGLCSGYLDPDYPPVERFLLRTLDVLLRPQRHGYANAELLGMVIGHARDVYWDTLRTIEYATGSIANPVVQARLAEYRGLITASAAPTVYNVSYYARELVMAKYESRISGGEFHGPVNTGSGGAHQNNYGGADLTVPLMQLSAAIKELSPTLAAEDAVAVEDAAAGLEREAGRAPEERAKPGILARLKALAEIAAGAGAAGAGLAAAVTAVRAAFGL